MLPRDGGHCHGSFVRYYYDQEAGVCRQFNYTGCGGNANKFAIAEDCSSLCAPRGLPSLRGQALAASGTQQDDFSCDEMMIDEFLMIDEMMIGEITMIDEMSFYDGILVLRCCPGESGHFVRLLGKQYRAFSFARGPGFGSADDGFVVFFLEAL